MHPNGESIFMVGDFNYWTKFKPYASVIERSNNTPVPVEDFPGGEVMDVIPDGTGGWYVASNFDIYPYESPSGLLHMDSAMVAKPGFPIVNGTVNTLKLRGDTLLFAGSFTSVNGQTRVGLAAISVTTLELYDLDVKINGAVNAMSLWNDTLFIGGEFDAINEFGSYGAPLDKFTGDVDAYVDRPNNVVTRSAPDGNGGWFIAGEFTAVDDSARLGLAHLNSDGRVSAWRCDLKNELGLSNVEVNALEVHGDHLYLAGQFHSVGGVIRKNAARIHKLTGQVDTWNPNLYGNPLCFGFGTESLYMGWQSGFNSVGQWVTNGGLVQADSSKLTALSQDIDGEIYLSTSDQSGGFFIAGMFDHIGDSARHRLAQLDADGAVTAFKANLPPGFTYPISALAFRNDVLYIGNNAAAEPLVAVDMQGNQVAIDFGGIGASSINLLKAIGDTLFIGGNFGNTSGGSNHSSVRAISLLDHELLSLSPALDGAVQDLELVGENLYLAGNFNSINHSSYGAVLAADGLDNGNGGMLTNGPVLESIGDGEGGFFISGSFTALANGNGCEGMAHIDSNGNVTCLDFVTDGTVRALLVKGDTLFIGGAFSEVNGMARSHFAAWSISNGQVLDWAPSFNNPLRDFGFFNGVLFVGGLFTEANSQARLRLAAFDLSTHALTAFAPSINGDVYALHVHESELLIGGGFSNVNLTSRGRLASFDLLTMNMTGWNPNANNAVWDIVSSENQIFVGGVFHTIGGITRHRLAGFDVGSASPNSLSAPFNTASHFVTSLATDGDKLLVGGVFGTLNNGNFRAFDLQNNQIISLPLANARVNCIAHSGDKFFVGGDFTKFSGQATSGLYGLNLATGNLLDFNPSFSGNISSLSSVGNILYAGGRPFSVDGNQVGKLAIFDLTTGQVVNNTTYFNSAPYSLTAITALHRHEDKIFIGLTSTDPSLSFNHHTNFAFCLNTIDNELTDFDPNAIGDVKTISANGDAVFIGGKIEHMGGTRISSFAAYDFESGNFLPDQLVFNFGSIYSLKIHGDLIFAGGNLISAGGGSQETLAAYNFDTQQEEVLQFSSGGLSGAIRDMYIYNDMLYFGGNYMGQTFKHAGAVDLNTNQFVQLDLPLQLVNGQIYAVRADDSGLYIAHSASNVMGTMRYVSAFDIDTYERIDGWEIATSGGQYPIMTTLSLQDDKLFIGGRSKLISNSRFANLASISLSSGLVNDWKPMANQKVNALLALDNGLYVGGAFTQINTIAPSAKYFSRLSRSANQVNAPVFFQAIKNEVYDIEYLPSSEHIYVSGTFTTSDGSSGNHLLAFSKETGMLASDWQAGPLERPVHLTLHDDSLWVHDAIFGQFEINYIRKLLPSGAFSNDSIPFFGSKVRTLAFQNNRIFAGGNMYGAGGIHRHRILEIDAATGELTDFNPGVHLDEILNVVLEGDNLILLGKIDNKFEVMGIDVNTYEVLPEFEHVTFNINYNDGRLELHNGEIFYQFNWEFRRKDALTGDELDVPNLVPTFAEMHPSNDFLYGRRRQFGGQSNEHDIFYRMDIEGAEFTDFDPVFNGLVDNMAALNGKVYFAGNFSEVDNMPISGLARVDGATGIVDDWTGVGIPEGEQLKIHSTSNSLFHSMFVSDPMNYYSEFRRVDLESGAISDWSLNVNADDVIEVGSRLYVAGLGYGKQNLYNNLFTAFLLDTCTTEMNCANVSVYLNEDGEASIDVVDIHSGTVSECAIQSLSLSQQSFTCDDLGENEVDLTAASANGSPSTCTAQVMVLDTINPVFAVEEMIYEIPENGSLEIDPADFILDMHDNCGIASLDIIGQITFTCEDQGEVIEIQIAVTDHSGNQSVIPTSVSILPSSACCNASASFEFNQTVVCEGQVIALPILLNGTAPFEITLWDNNDTLTFAISAPEVDSIYVSPLISTTYQIIAVSDSECTALAESAFELIVDQASTAGPDQDISLCANGEEVQFIDYQHPEASSTSVFSQVSGGIASSSLSGNYLLIFDSQACTNDTALYHFDFTDPGLASNISIFCDQPNPYVYEVSFDVIGGTPPYASSTGEFTGNAFSSFPISVLDEPETIIVVSDNSGCEFTLEATIDDTNGNGVCDQGEIVGCMDPAAADFNPFATSPGVCMYSYQPPIELTDELDSGVDLDGIAEHDNPIVNPEDTWEISIYPNPIALGKPLNVWFQKFSTELPISIEVRDIAGRLIQSEVVIPELGDSRISLNHVQSISQGVYLISFQNESKRITEWLIVL